MPCYKPLTAYRSRSGRDKETGKWPVTFNLNEGYIDMKVDLPCGQCIGCRLEHSRQWAIRCVHEASLHKDNCFITLTFSDENLNSNNSLDKQDFVKFMKRLRKKYISQTIRYFHCGEYGSQSQRPHHHACLFGFDFSDKLLWNVRQGVRLYRSPTLEELWPYGFCTVGDVTFDSAAYVARYIMKKITGDAAPEHYKGRVPEYTTMSRRPGLGKGWYEQFTDDVYPHDYIVIRGGIKCKPPRYYNGLYDLDNPESFEKVKYNRKVKAREYSENNREERLRVREKVQELKSEKLVRTVE